KGVAYVLQGQSVLGLTTLRKRQRGAVSLRETRRDREVRTRLTAAPAIPTIESALRRFRVRYEPPRFNRGFDCATDVSGAGGAVQSTNGGIVTINLAVGPVVALIAGVLILIVPRLLNYIVAIYLIVIGLVGVFGWGGTHVLRSTGIENGSERVATILYSADVPSQPARSIGIGSTPGGR